MPQAESRDLDSDLRLRLSQAMLNQSLRPVEGAEKATRIEPRPEEQVERTIVVGEEEQRAAHERDLARGSVGLPKRMSGVQEWVLVPLSDAPEGVIGYGGEGIVYSYVQRELGREVAVKTLRADRWSYGAIESLLREACVTARLEHPSIVPVYYLHLSEYDEDSPYWAMKWVRGKPLTEHLPTGGEPWPFDRLLEVFRRILDAVAFAHSRGIVHRDLKPDNVLVGAFGEVQVTDWGLAVAVNEEGARGAAPVLDDDGRSGVERAAKAEEDHILSEDLAKLNEDVRSGRVGALLNTSAGGRSGTPAYMAPEQLELTAGSITARTDVFLLGGILYAVMTGQPPHRFGGGDDTDAARQRLRQIRSCSSVVLPGDRRREEGMSPVPEGLSAQAFAGLTSVVMKALAAEQTQRFATVGELAEALNEWESRSTSQELSAQATTRLEEVSSHRRPSARGYAEVIALANASLEKWEANEEARRIREDASSALAMIQRRSVRRFWTAAAAIALVFLVGGIGYHRTRFQWRRAEVAREEVHAKAQELATRLDDAYWEAYTKFAATHDPIGQLLAASAAQDNLQANSIDSSRHWAHLAQHTMASSPCLAGSTPVSLRWWCVAYSPDGTTLAAGNVRGDLKLWDVATGREKAVLRGHKGSVWRAAFSPDGKILASASYDGTVGLWDPAAGRQIAVLKGHANRVTSVAFSPDGETLASGSDDRTVRLWDVAKRRHKATLKGHASQVTCTAFSPSGGLLASGSYDHTIKLWDVASAQVSRTLKGHEGHLVALAFSPDGRTLASGGRDQTVKLWDVESGLLKTSIDAHEERLTAIAFSPNGDVVASGAHTDTIKLWDAVSGQRRAILEGHTNHPTDLAFSPDGRTLASSSLDHTIKLWDVASGGEKASLPRDTDSVWIVAFSADGETVASGSEDYRIRLWDATTGQRKGTLEGHRDVISSLALSPDGRQLVSGTYGGAIKLWDVAREREKMAFEGHPKAVMGIAFSPDGKTVASCGEDRVIKLWDVATGQETATLTGHSEWLLSVAFSPDGRTLASGCLSADDPIKLWDVPTGREKATLKGHVEGVWEVLFSPDGRMLASGGQDQTIRLWDLPEGREKTVMHGHSSQIRSLAFSADGQTLVSGSVDSNIMLWDLIRGEPKATLRGHRGWVWSVALSPDGLTLVSGSNDNTIKLWDLAKDWRTEPLKGHAKGVQCVAFSPDGQTVASASFDHTVRLWDVTTGRPKGTIEAHSDAVYAVAFSPDGQMLASGSADRTVRLWHVQTARQEATLEGHTDDVIAVAFSPDGRTLAAGSEDYTVRLWDVKTGRHQTTLEGHTNDVTGVAFSPDGALLASSSYDNTIRLWDTSTRRMKLMLTGYTPVVRGHYGRVLGVTFTPDGKTLASANRDRLVMLWDVATGREIASLSGHEDWVHGIAFSPDGRTLASSGADHVVKLWDVATKREKATLRGHGAVVMSVAFRPNVGPAVDDKPFAWEGAGLASASSDGTVRLWDATDPAALPQTEASRVTGAGLEGFEAVALSVGAYETTAHFEGAKGFHFKPAPPPTSEPNPYLQVRWRQHHPFHWLNRARTGDAKARYALAIIGETQHRDREAIRLHQQVAASTDPAHAPYARRSRHRLRTIPWLQHRPQKTDRME